MAEEISSKGKKAPQTQKSVFFSALGMGLGTLLSRFLGFFRDILLVGLFPQGVSDAFVLGFRVPNFFRRVLGEGALSVSFIPNYLELKQKSPEKARQLSHVVFSFVSLLSMSLCLLSFFFTEELILFIVQASSLKEVHIEVDYLKRSVEMARWMIFYLFLVVEFAYCMSVLNAHKKFFMAGLAPALFNLGFILIVLASWYFELPLSFEGQELAVGVLVGGLLQLLIVVRELYKYVELPSFNFSFDFKPFKRVLLATIPSILGIGILQIISFINIGLCAQVGQGSLTYLYLADRILELPQSLIAVSLGTAMLPNLSELWIKSRKEFDLSLQRSLRLYLYFAIPSALGLVFLSLPITQLLFQRGQTTLEEVKVVSSLIQIYGFLLMVGGMNRILLPIYYSFKNTWYPAVVSVFVVVGHYFIGNFLVQEFALEGVVSSTLISSFVNFSLLIVGLKIFVGRFYLLGILKSLVSFLPLALMLAGFLFVVRQWIPEEKNLVFYSMTLVSIGASAFLYFASTYLFKLEEARYIGALLRKFLPK